MNVFTYGTLMFPEVWQMVVGRIYSTLGATLPGHAIFAVRGVVYPGMIRTDDSCVAQGLVYLEVETTALAQLDQFEDDFYARELVTIACSDGHERKAYAYIIRDEERHVLTNQRWSADEFTARGDLARFIARYGGFCRIRSDQA